MEMWMGILIGVVGVFFLLLSLIAYAMGKALEDFKVTNHKEYFDAMSKRTQYRGFTVAVLKSLMYVVGFALVTIHVSLNKLKLN